jgi:MoaA/NifB/PqqE/SkfB family radical SAM enzyme
MKIFNHFSARRRRKPFLAWQIEVTTRCPLKCRMCIKEAYPDWLRRDMSLQDFRMIVPYLRDVESVVLEGWGESLLHGNLTDFIGLAKSEGPEVGFVTSGQGMEETMARELVKAGIDFIGFSLSGATKETHNSIRVNSDFDSVMEAIGLLAVAIRAAKATKPRIHIVYLMLEDNIAELPLLIDVARRAGVTDIVLIHMALITTDWQEGQKVFASSHEKEYEQILAEASAKARRLKIKLTSPVFTPGEAAVCSENPLRNLYISVGGEVSPCVYLYPPIVSPFTQISGGGKHCVEKVSFGNILQEPFETIWERREYIQFRERFLRRQKKMGELYTALLEAKRMEETALTEPPDPCKICPRISGA